MKGTLQRPVSQLTGTVEHKRQDIALQPQVRCVWRLLALLSAGRPMPIDDAVKNLSAGAQKRFWSTIGGDCGLPCVRYTTRLAGVQMCSQTGAKSLMPNRFVEADWRIWNKGIRSRNHVSVCATSALRIDAPLCRSRRHRSQSCGVTHGQATAARDAGARWPERRIRRRNVAGRADWQPDLQPLLPTSSS